MIRIKNRNPNSWPPGAYGNWYPSPWKLISWYLNNVPRAFNLPNTVNLYSSLLSSYPESQHKKPVVFHAVTEIQTQILYHTATRIYFFPPLPFFLHIKDKSRVRVKVMPRAWRCRNETPKPNPCRRGLSPSTFSVAPSHPLATHRRSSCARPRAGLLQGSDARNHSHRGVNLVRSVPRPAPRGSAPFPFSTRSSPGTHPRPLSPSQPAAVPAACSLLFPGNYLRARRARMEEPLPNLITV